MIFKTLLISANTFNLISSAQKIIKILLLIGFCIISIDFQNVKSTQFHDIYKDYKICLTFLPFH